MLGWYGVDSAINRAAGPELRQETQTLGNCCPGDAKMTSAYGLPCKKVIHTVGSRDYVVDAAGAEETLVSCYRRCLEVAVYAGMKSVAFCSISTGAYGFPIVEAAKIALREVRLFLQSDAGSKLQRVVFCCFSRSDELAYLKFVP